MSNCDPAESPEASYFRHPVEDIEPILTDTEELAIAAEVFHRVLVWSSQGKTLVEAGQRLNVMLYILAPDLIGAATLEKIGAANGHTRQNIDKMVQDFRDTFQGQKNGAMKSEAARRAYTKCQL